MIVQNVTLFCTYVTLLYTQLYTLLRYFAIFHTISHFSIFYLVSLVWPNLLKNEIKKKFVNYQLLLNFIRYLTFIIVLSLVISIIYKIILNSVKWCKIV